MSDSTETINQLKDTMSDYRNIASVLSRDLAYGSIEKKQYAREVLLRAFNLALAVNENNNKTGLTHNQARDNGLITTSAWTLNHDQRKNL